MPALSLTIGAEQLLEVDSGDRGDVLRILSDAIAREAELPGDEILNAVLAREELASTGFGAGLAMPHVRLPGVRRLHAVLGRTRSGIGFDALDGLPVHLLLMIVGPEQEKARYQQLMARAARFLKAEGARLIASDDLRAAAASALQEY